MSYRTHRESGLPRSPAGRGGLPVLCPSQAEREACLQRRSGEPTGLETDTNYKTLDSLLGIKCCPNYFWGC